MQITHQITIDMALQLPSVPIAAVQGDGNTRVLAVTLLENGAPWQIPAEAVVDVAFRKPDGTKGIYSKLPDGSSATQFAGNILSATLAPQMLTCPGPVLATVVFRTGGEKTLAAFPFTIVVEASPAAGAEISEDYFNPTQLGDLRAEIAAGLATKAPAGYGLGDVVTELTSADDLIHVKGNGWYRWSINNPPKNAPAGTYYMDIMRVSGTGAACIQEFFDISNSSTYGIKAQRIMYGSQIIGDLEWVNPPMAPGVEYRTTERWNGKAVYTIAFDFGVLPNNEIKSVSHGISNIDTMIFKEIIATASGDSRTITSSAYITDIAANRKTLRIQTNGDLSNWTGVFYLKYTKTTG